MVHAIFVLDSRPNRRSISLFIEFLQITLHWWQRKQSFGMSALEIWTSLSNFDTNNFLTRNFYRL